jgi:ribosomal protein RSM22 (predicted rRNA methylase)
MQQSEQVSRLQELEGKTTALMADLDEARRQTARVERQASTDVTRSRAELKDKAAELTTVRKEVIELSEQLKVVQGQLEERLVSAADGGVLVIRLPPQRVCIPACGPGCHTGCRTVLMQAHIVAPLRLLVAVCAPSLHDGRV